MSWCRFGTRALAVAMMTKTYDIFEALGDNELKSPVFFQTRWNCDLSRGWFQTGIVGLSMWMRWEHYANQCCLAQLPILWNTHVFPRVSHLELVKLDIRQLGRSQWLHCQCLLMKYTICNCSFGNEMRNVNRHQHENRILQREFT